MGLSIAVPRQRAQEAVEALSQAGALDPSRRIASAEEVLLPVREGVDAAAWAARLAGRVVADAPLAAREGRVTPHEEVLARLPDLAPALRALVPGKWERLGDVLVLRLDAALLPRAREVARAFADAMGVRCVVLDERGVEGELREMGGVLLYGDDPVATHVENGIRYRLDASRIMFSSGNVHERRRAAAIPARGETVVDMFAGIGYFTLPLAVHAGAAKVHALEKNPLSFRFLRENVALNGVERVVAPWLGDNRDFPDEGIADRVMMGYFPGTARFLPKAMALLKPAGGVVHYHDTAHAQRWKDEMTQALLAAARACGAVVAIEEARVVKSQSPGVVHAVLVARVRR